MYVTGMLDMSPELIEKRANELMMVNDSLVKIVIIGTTEPRRYTSRARLEFS